MEILRMGVEKFRRHLGDLLQRVTDDNERIVVEHDGTPLAVVVPYEFYQQLEPFIDSKGNLHLPADDIGVPLSKLRAELEYAGVTYEDLAAGMRRERIRTLKEHFPELYQRYLAEEAEADVTGELA